ncbi:MAG: hypothetical protein MRY21_05850 [Simkaniaceae bacterium]|nr:hypothetical protein [Simkaniaceae bacterium]
MDPLSAADHSKLEKFWTEVVDTTHLLHGSHTLFRDAIETHGFSSYRPHAERYGAMHALFETFKDRYTVTYLSECIERYRSPSISVYFTLDPKIAEEFSSGERRGSEFAKALRHFIYALKSDVREGKVALTFDDRNQLTVADEFIRDTYRLPSMIAKVKCSSSALNDTFTPFLGDLEAFKAKTVAHMTPTDTVDTILERFRENFDKPGYEIQVTQEIPASEIELDIHENGLEMRTPSPIPEPEIGELPFDVTIHMSVDEIIKYEIDYTGKSSLPQFADSRFETEYLGFEEGFTLIRRHMTSHSHA